MREKTIWIREYKLTGRLIWGSGVYAIKKYYQSGRLNRPPVYAISISPKRRSWYRCFFEFNHAAKFARDLIKDRNK